MSNTQQGRIILVEIVDPQGQNIKTRPAVIVSRNDQIKAESVIDCVAVTSSVPDEIPDDCVLLPFDPTGRSRTGLRIRCAAMCSWLFEITEDEIEKYIGVVSSKKLQEILACIEKRKQSRPQ